MASPSDVVTEDDLVDAFASAFSEPGQVALVVKRAGFPLAALSKANDLRVVWAAVLHDARHGKLAGGVRAVVEAAKKDLPHNDVLERYLRQLDPRAAEPPITDPGWDDRLAGAEEALRAIPSTV